MFYYKKGKLMFHVDSRCRYRRDLRYNLNLRMSKLIWYSLKKNKAGRTWKSLIFYTLDNLMEHLKETMPKGYNWQDYLKGKLHIDHIIPRKAFVFDKSTDEDFKLCWSLHNLRLLPAKKNMYKHFTIENPILLGILINMLTRSNEKVIS